MKQFVIMSLAAALALTFSSASAQVVEIDPETLDFGRVGIDETGELMLTVHNVSQNEIVVVIVSSDSEHFPTGFDLALPAQSTILEILEAIWMYNSNNGVDPSSVEELIEEDYIEIDEEILAQWSFTLIGANPIAQIESVSTAEMKGGAGRVVLFDIGWGRFTGFGAPTVFEVDEEHLFPVFFTPDEVREFEGTLTLYILDSDWNIIDEVSLGMRGVGTESSVKDGSLSAIPAAFHVSQAYPNPFNAEIKVSYYLPHHAHITISVFDLAGRQVAMLFDGEHPGGRYTVAWQGDNAASGVYMVRFESMGFSAVRKVMLGR